MPRLHINFRHANDDEDTTKRHRNRLTRLILPQRIREVESAAAPETQSGNGMYHVTRTRAFAIGWICDCPDFTHREAKCKHTWAVEFSAALRQTVESQIVIHPLTPLSCRFCGSEKIVKDAKRHNQYGDIQRYLCKSCSRRFAVNIGFDKMKASPQIITSSMQLYFSGESLRNVQKFLKLQGVNVSHVAVYKWIKKYRSLMESYLEQIKPQVSDTWRADELFSHYYGHESFFVD